MSSIDETLYEALCTVHDPELRRPITELGMVEKAYFEQGVAHIHVLLTIEGCPLKTTIEHDITQALSGIEGVQQVQVHIGYMNPQQRQKLRSTLGHKSKNPFSAEDSLTRVYAVVSGKGGVGKSSMTANLAASFAADGLSVGVVDADVYGFSIPGLFGIEQAPTRFEDMILPPVLSVPENVSGHGSGCVKVISMGMFVAGNKPVAWRGPMLHRALEQFLTDVHFGAIDILLLDLPPGTGDIAISMAQLLPTAELVLISTPQSAAVDVAERAGTMSVQTQQKVAGVIENMAAMRMPDGSMLDIFGAGGGVKLSERLSATLGYDVPLLGSVPLDVSLRTGGDAGVPLVWADTSSETAQSINRIARQLSHRARNLNGKPLPFNV
ncbi:Mrp/NBP35 family ATP-binding protein [Rothia sp. CCM 9418]|uniref:Mrp/NBP35 family ATP-binding protein n=1 Tax=Rothia sp. CCM 9418 TaxID=3402661 RepID=UPI003AEB65EE